MMRLNPKFSMLCLTALFTSWFDACSRTDTAGVSETEPSQAGNGGEGGMAAMPDAGSGGSQAGSGPPSCEDGMEKNAPWPAELRCASRRGSTEAMVPPGAVLRWATVVGDLTAGSSPSSPTVDALGTIYVASQGRGIVALAPDGSQKWSYMTKGGFSSSVTVGADGGLFAV